MTGRPFRAKAYVKAGCPYSFKFMVFMMEAGLLDAVELVRLDPDQPDFEKIKSRLSEGLGEPATFPTVEVARGEFLADSDALIERYAKAHGADADRLPVLSFYKQTIFPQLIELHRLEQDE